MAPQAHKDPNGTLWRVEKEAAIKSEDLDVFWIRDKAQHVRWKRHKPRLVQKEMLVLRQENDEEAADVIMLTLGQAYDLLTAVSKAIEGV